MFLCLSFTEQCFLRIRKFLTGWYTGSRCCCSTKTTLQDRSNMYQTVGMLSAIYFLYLFLFSISCLFWKAIYIIYFNNSCLFTAYMVFFKLCYTARTLAKLTLVRISYCLITLVFCMYMIPDEKKMRWNFSPPPPFFFLKKHGRWGKWCWDSDIQSHSQMCSWQGSQIFYMAAINSFLSPRNRDD